ncbi:MAG: serine/threonine protein kinase, partial [Alphaproteobacteria bacterium]
MIDIPYALPEGTLLAGDFRITAILGAGGFGITYRARDIHLKRDVAIKEYFPKMFAHREGGSSVRATSGGGKADYNWGLERFLNEAQMLAQIKHPNVVGVSRYFRENNTAYLVLELLQGEDFESWLKQRREPPAQADLDRLAAPLLDALALVHENGILHRDIKPANIFIRAEDGEPVLIDFGASRHSMGEHTGTTAAIASPGYSPSESYSGKVAHQGPWSDIYGLAATFYRALTGRPPSDATGRLIEEDYEPLSARPELANYRPGFLQAIDEALA